MDKLRKCHARIPGDDILDGMIREVGPYAFTVYVILALHQDWQEHVAFPSRERIRDLTGFDLRTIESAVEKLVENEYIIDIEYRKSIDKDGEEYGREHYFYRLKPC